MDDYPPLFGLVTVPELLLPELELPLVPVLVLGAGV